MPRWEVACLNYQVRAELDPVVEHAVHDSIADKKKGPPGIEADGPDSWMAGGYAMDQRARTAHICYCAV